MTAQPSATIASTVLAPSVDMYLRVDTVPFMTPLRPTNFRLESELLEGLQKIRERDGIPVSEQVRRAIQTWLEEKGIVLRAERKRAATRKRP